MSGEVKQYEGRNCGAPLRRHATTMTVLLGLLAAGCGSGGQSHPTASSPSPSTSSPAASSSTPEAPLTPSGDSATAATAIGALRSVPDTASSRGSIVIDDLAAIWRANGLGAIPTPKQVNSRTGTLATTQLSSGGAPIGTNLLSVVPAGTKIFGYPILGLRVQLDVGTLPDDVGEVWGPITAANVATAVRGFAKGSAEDPPSTVYDFGSTTNTSGSAISVVALADVSSLVVPHQGGDAASAGKEAPATGAIDLANQTQVPDALSADPTVAPLLKAFGSNIQSITMGTVFITPGPAAANARNPIALKKLETQSGLSRLSAGPEMVGLAYTGGSGSAEAVTAAAWYPTAADARTAVQTVGKYTANGFSYILSERYSKLWKVTSDTAQGQLVVMHLMTRGGAPTEQLLKEDFPLFWRP